MPSRQRGLKKPSKLHHRVKLRVKSDDQCLLVSLSKEDRDTYLLHEDNVKRFLSSSNLRVSGDFIDSLAQITAKASKFLLLTTQMGPISHYLKTAREYWEKWICREQETRMP